MKTIITQFILISLLAAASPAEVQAQAKPCVDFPQIEARIKHEFEVRKNFSEVLKQLDAARACYPSWEGLTGWYERVFQAITQQRENALLAERKAVAEAERARKLQAQAETITKNSLIKEYLNHAERARRENNLPLALQLVDFAYTYVDSTHQDLHRFIYQLYVDLLAQHTYEDTYTARDSVSRLATISPRATAWSTDGKLAVGLESGQIIILTSGAAADAPNVHRFYTQTRGITSLAWSPDGQTLAIGHAAGELEMRRSSDWTVIGNIAVNTYIEEIAWSPGGRRLAVATWAGDARIYRWPEGKQDKRLAGHNDYVRGVAWSPDGNQLATCADDGKALIWDVNTESILYTLEEHTDYVRDVAWSPTDDILVTVSDDNRAIVWDGKGTQLRVINDHTNWIMCVAFSPDGRFFATGANDNYLNVYDSKTYSQTRRQDLGHQILDLAWSPDGELIAPATIINGNFNAIGSNGEFAYAEGIPLQAQSQDALPIFGDSTLHLLSMAWSPDGLRLAGAGSDGQLRIYNYADSTIQSIRAGQGALLSVSWSPDGTQLATVGTDKRLRIWDAGTLHISGGSNFGEQTYYNVAWSPDNDYIAMGGDGNYVDIYSVTQGRIVAQLTGHSDWIRRLAWSHRNSWLATASDDGTIRVWNVAAGTEEKVLTGHEDYVRDLAWSPNDSLIASAADDHRLLLWRWRQATIMADLPLGISGEDATAVAFSSDGKYVLATANTPSLSIWETSNTTATEPLNKMTFDHPIYHLLWHPNENLVALASAGEAPLLLNPASLQFRSIDWKQKSLQSRDQLQPIALETSAYATDGDIAWSPDGNYLAMTVGYGQLVEVYDMRVQRAVFTVDRHVDAVTDIAWSPNSQYLATGGNDGQIFVYQVSTGVPKFSQENNFGTYIRKLDWSPDGSRLVIGTSDYELLLWDLQEDKINKNTIQVDGSAIAKVAFSPVDNNLVAIQTDAGHIMVSRLQPYQNYITRHYDYIQSWQWAPDGKSLTIKDEKSLESYLVPQGLPLLGGRIEPGEVSTFAWSPDGKTLAVAGKKAVKFYDNVFRPLPLSFSTRGNTIVSIHWSPNSSYLALLEADGAVILYDRDKQLLVLPDTYTKVLWSPDGRYLTTINEYTNTPRFWYLNPIGLLQAMRDNVEDIAFSPKDIEDYNLEAGLQTKTKNLSQLTTRANMATLLGWAAYFHNKASLYGTFTEQRPHLLQAIDLMEKTRRRSPTGPINHELRVGYSELLTDYAWQLLQVGRIDSARVYVDRALALDSLGQRQRELHLYVHWLQGRQSPAFHTLADLIWEGVTLEKSHYLMQLATNDIPIPERLRLTRLLTLDSISFDLQHWLELPEPPYSPSLDQLTANYPLIARLKYQAARLRKANAQGTEGLGADYHRLLTAMSAQYRGSSGAQRTANQAFYTQLLSDALDYWFTQAVKETSPLATRLALWDTLTVQLNILRSLAPEVANERSTIATMRYYHARTLQEAGRLQEALRVNEQFVDDCQHLLMASSNAQRYYRSLWLDRALAQRGGLFLLSRQIDSAAFYLNPIWERDSLDAPAEVVVGQAHLLALQGRDEDALVQYSHYISIKYGTFDAIYQDWDAIGYQGPLRQQLRKVEEEYQVFNRLQEVRGQQSAAIRQAWESKDYALMIEQGKALMETVQELIAVISEPKSPYLPIYIDETMFNDLGSDVGNFSFYALFAKAFALSVDAAQQAAALNPQPGWIKTNLGHGYLYQGDWEKAFAIYDSIKDLPNDGGSGEGIVTLGDALLKDIRDLRAAGVWHPLVPRAAAYLLGQDQLTEEQLKEYGPVE